MTGAAVGWPSHHKEARMDGTNLTALVALAVTAFNLIEINKLKAKIKELESTAPGEGHHSSS